MAIRKNDDKQLNIFLNTYSDLIGVVVITLALILSYILIIHPKFNSTINTITQNIEEQRMIFNQQSQKLANLKANLILYKKIDEKEIARVDSLLPNSYIEERLFGELEEMITKNGYAISSIDIKGQDSAPSDNAANGSSIGYPDEAGNLEAGGTVSTPVARDNISSDKLGLVEVSVSITSIDYAGLKNLLPVFENNLRLFDVTKLSFSPNDKTADITFLTYYYNTGKE